MPRTSRRAGATIAVRTSTAERESAKRGPQTKTAAHRAAVFFAVKHRLEPTTPNESGGRGEERRSWMLETGNRRRVRAGGLGNDARWPLLRAFWANAVPTSRGAP